MQSSESLRSSGTPETQVFALEGCQSPGVCPRGSLARVFVINANGTMDRCAKPLGAGCLLLQDPSGCLLLQDKKHFFHTGVRRRKHKLGQSNEATTERGETTCSKIMFSLSRLYARSGFLRFFNLYDKSWPNSWVNFFSNWSFSKNLVWNSFFQGLRILSKF